MKFEIRNAISGLTVEAVLSGHDAGVGRLAAATADTITWQAPGADDAGAAVAIANGETKIVKADDTSLQIVVSRTSATDLSGTSLVIVSGSVAATDLLAAVESCIVETLKAQSEGVGDIRLQRAELASLREFRAALLTEIAADEAIPGGRVASCDMRELF